MLKKGLESISRDFPFLGEPRGLGLMLGLPVLGNQKWDGAERTDQILEEMKDRGFLLGKNGLGRDVLAFQPPLVISPGVIDSMLDHLRKTVRILE
jgi:alanine-glyoxylate transaminase/(R)-3-amino-2-methylpropionate-pyruvate transaminase